MPLFELSQPVETDTPTVEVEISRERPLRPGKYLFTLQVVDDDGNVSPPAEAVVVISDPGPTARLRAPEVVAFGEPFKLDGSESGDVGGGRLVRYIWTLVEAN